MRRVLIALWLLIPVGAFAYHLGPGQMQLDIEEAATRIAEGNDAAALARAAYGLDAAAPETVVSQCTVGCSSQVGTCAGVCVPGTSAKASPARALLHGKSGSNQSQPWAPEVP